MRYRTHQGVTISEIGVGCYTLSGVYGFKDRAQFRTMLRRAVDLGVTFFDTAEGYGPEAEELLGEEQSALNLFLQEEDRRLAAERHVTCREILVGSLVEQDEQAFADLVYVLETLAEEGSVGEKEAFPLLRRLLDVRGGKDASALRPLLLDAQATLRGWSETNARTP